MRRWCYFSGVLIRSSTVHASNWGKGVEIIIIIIIMLPQIWGNGRISLCSGFAVDWRGFGKV